MFQGAANFWEENIVSKFENIWSKITGKIEEKRPELERELEKEKQEIKEGLQQGAKEAGKGLWQRFLDLFRDDKSSPSPEPKL